MSGSNKSHRVIYHLDPVNPMDDSEVLVLGGAGRYSMAGLRRKAARESSDISTELSLSNPSYRSVAHMLKQLTNTVATIQAALSELEEIRRKGGMRSRGIPSMDESTLNENPLIMMGLRGLVAAAPVVARSAMSIARWAMKNPGKATVAGMAAEHPDTAMDIAKGAASFIADPAAASKQAAVSGAYATVDAAKSGIESMVGSMLSSTAITTLAELVVEWALPVAGVVALLYGGKKLYDWLSSNEPSPAIQSAIKESILRESSSADRKAGAMDPVTELEDELTNMSANGETLDYDSVDGVMWRIASTSGITPDELHDEFGAKHGQTPDAWVSKLAKKQQQESLLREAIELKTNLGHMGKLGWVAVTKGLVARGHHPKQVQAAVDAAINLKHV